MLECFQIVLVYLSSKLPCVFIFIEVTWFVPSNIYLPESMNHAFYKHGDGMNMHECLSHKFFSSRCAIQFCLSFAFFARYKTKQTRIPIRHSPFTGYFFFYWFFFQARKVLYLTVTPTRTQTLVQKLQYRIIWIFQKCLRFGPSFRFLHCCVNQRRILNWRDRKRVLVDFTGKKDSTKNETKLSTRVTQQSLNTKSFFFLVLSRWSSLNVWILSCINLQKHSKHTSF